MPMTKREVNALTREEATREMLRPENAVEMWPHFPRLPMRNYRMDFLSEGSLGVIVYPDMVTIHVGLLWQGKFDEKESFGSVDEMMAKGWMVD